MMEVLQALSQWPVAAFIRQSGIAYPLVNAAHIFSLALVVGSITTLDLRILGLFRRVPLTVLAHPLSRVAAVGIALAIVTGFLLFSTRPTTYVQNPAFLAKISLVVIGVLNAVGLHRTRSWRRALNGDGMGRVVRVSAIVSILVWLAAVVAGRWIGFLQ